MRLTYEEQQMLNGERGEAVQRAMDLLVTAKHWVLRIWSRSVLSVPALS